jgi:hypothetical protein
LFLIEGIVVLFGQEFKEIELQDVGYAHKQGKVDGRLFVDTIDISSVATQFFRQPDSGFSLSFHFFKNLVAYMHSEIVFCSSFPLKALKIKRRGEPTVIILAFRLSLSLHRKIIVSICPRLLYSKEIPCLHVGTHFPGGKDV